MPTKLKLKKRRLLPIFSSMTNFSARNINKKKVKLLFANEK